MSTVDLSKLFTVEAFRPVSVDLGEFGLWQVVGELGEGGYGKTFRAVSEPDGEEIALKVVHEEHVESAAVLKTFETESAALRSVDSPWIVKILGSGASQGFPWIATELVKGPTLWDELQAGKLNDERFRLLALSLSGALVDAHEKKVSHNDLKPSNIMFDVRKSKYVVIDFGIGRFQRIRGVRHDEFLGTPFYASPEQHRGRSFVGSDVYSAGLVLLEALTGSNPLRDAASATVIASGLPGLIIESERAASRPVGLDGISARFGTVLSGMLNRDPVARFTAIQVRHEWEMTFGLTPTQRLVESPPATPTGMDGFVSGKIQFESWREVEKAIVEKVAADGLADFWVDVNTSSKIIVNFRVVPHVDGFRLQCPATGSRTQLRSLGWQFDGPSETYSKYFDGEYSVETFSRDITSALQIGFGVRLAEVGLLL